jgi:hypothetical protein
MTEQEEKKFVAAKEEEYTPWPVYWVYIPFLLIGLVLGVKSGTGKTPELQRPSRLPLWLWVAAAASIASSPLINAL